MGTHNLVSANTPPDWALWVGSGGRIAVGMAVALFAVSALAWLFAARAPRLEKLGKAAFTAGALSIFATFGALAVLFVNNRFEFEYVWGHTDSRNALPYRIAAIWSGQEGSFLLWATCAALLGLLAVRGTGDYRRWFTIVYASFLAAICGILAYESPFLLNFFEGRVVVPEDGFGLSPALQNYWVTIHPPTIFLGFASLTIPFALAVAALARRDYDGWIPIVRPWAIVSTTLVGVGLCMGGFWAYETLGWGGFWMWDPVENVSFVPWCLGIAFIHGMIVQTTRKKWQISNLLFGALPFLAFVYGTFLTRSGFLADTSVHSFAEMNRSALWLLMGVLGTTTLGFLGLWLVRAFQERRPSPERPAIGWSRQGFYQSGSILLTAMGLAALIGMSVPLFKVLAGKPPAVVEEGVYHFVMPWIFIPTMLLMAIAPFATWRSMGLSDLMRRIYSVLCITIGLAGALVFALRFSALSRIADLAPSITFPMGWKLQGPAWIVLLASLCLFVVVANAWRIGEMARGSKLGLGGFVSHMGIAVLMAGLILSRGFERRGETIVMQDQPGQVLSYNVALKGMTSDLFDRDNKVEFEVSDPHDGGKILFVARPGLYYVPDSTGEPSPMVWPFIHRSWGYDVYFTLRPPQTESSPQISFKPGETKSIGGMRVTYDRMVRVGEPGVAGTRFGAHLTVLAGNEALQLVPQLELTGEGVIPVPAEINEEVSLALVGMDAGSQAVTLQTHVSSPLYPVEIFHKPFTSFVWGGTAAMMLGGFMAAFYRRPRKPAPEAVEPIAEPQAETARVPTGVH